MGIKLKFRQSDRKKKRIKKNTVLLPLDFSPTLEKEIEIAAALRGMSPNQYVVSALESHLKTLNGRQRSRRDKRHA